MVPRYIFPGDGYDDLLKPAEEIPVGVRGHVQAHLTGERACTPTRSAGGVRGLTVRHIPSRISAGRCWKGRICAADCYALMTSSGLPR